MKALSSILIFFFLGSFALAQSDYHDASGYVEIKGRKAGSCFFIKDESKDGKEYIFAITCFHVIGKAEEEDVTICKKEEDIEYKSNVKFIFCDSEQDIALVLLKKTEGFTVPDITINTKTPKIGEKVKAVSNPYGLDYTYCEGYVSNVKRYAGLLAIYQINILAYPGSSGSGVFNDKLELVGMIFSIRAEITKDGILVPASFITFAIRGKDIYTSLKNGGMSFLLDEQTVPDQIVELLK